MINQDSLSQATCQAYDSCLVLTCWWLVFPINCQQARRFVELACTIEILKGKRFPMRIILFKSTFASMPQLWTGERDLRPLWRHCHTTRVENGPISPMRASQENRGSRCEWNLWVDIFYVCLYFQEISTLFHHFGCVFFVWEKGPFKESFWQVSWDW